MMGSRKAVIAQNDRVAGFFRSLSGTGQEHPVEARYTK